MKPSRIAVSLFAFAALSACNEIKDLNGTMTLHETDPVVINDAGGGPVTLQQGPTEVGLEKGVFTVHNNLTTITLNVDKKLVKDLSKFTIPGSTTGQAYTISGTAAVVAVDQNATPTLQSCYQHDFFGEQPDRRCESGRANVWRCAWGTRPVTEFSSTTTNEYTVRFTRDSDQHEVATFVARLSKTESQVESGGRCDVDRGRNWDICDYRCIAPPRPIVIVRPEPQRPQPQHPQPQRPEPGHAQPRPQPQQPPHNQDPRRGGHPGRPLPPPPEQTLPPPPMGK